MELDTVVVNGRVVLPDHGVREVDLGIRDGRIAWVARRAESISGRERIDVEGRHVLPGVIDAHTHIGIGNGLADIGTETRAAAFGGVTTVLFFLREPAPYEPLFRETIRAADSTASVDFGLHAALLTEQHLDELPSYVRDLGIRSFKLYMTHRGPDAQARAFSGEMSAHGGIDDGYMLEAFRRVAGQPGSVLMVHCENIEIVARARRELQAAGADSLAAWNASRPPIAELDGVRRALLYARETGCPLHIVHLTTAAALDEVRRARRTEPAVPVSVEVCHPHLACTEGTFSDHRGKVRPPLRGQDDVDDLWSGVRDGTVTTIGSDHVPRPLRDKLGSYWSLTAGAPGTPYLLPVMIEEGVHARGIPLERVVELVATGPARRFGLHPRKGSLQIGADADLAVVDLDDAREMEPAALGGASDFSLYDGRRLRGWPSLTMVRGRVIAGDGVVGDAAGWGRYLPR